MRQLYRKANDYLVPEDGQSPPDGYYPVDGLPPTADALRYTYHHGARETGRYGLLQVWMEADKQEPEEEKKPASDAHADDLRRAKIQRLRDKEYKLLANNRAYKPVDLQKRLAKIRQKIADLA